MHDVPLSPVNGESPIDSNDQQLMERFSANASRYSVRCLLRDMETATKESPGAVAEARDALAHYLTQFWHFSPEDASRTALLVEASVTAEKPGASDRPRPEPLQNRRGQEDVPGRR
jgi:hypothetical protein